MTAAAAVAGIIDNTETDAIAAVLCVSGTATLASIAVSLIKVGLSNRGPHNVGIKVSHLVASPARKSVEDLVGEIALARCMITGAEVVIAGPPLLATIVIAEVVVVAATLKDQIGHRRVASAAAVRGSRSSAGFNGCYRA